MNKKVKDMHTLEQSRWFCLFRAVDILEENCDATGRPFEDIDLKPIPLKHYINTKAKGVERVLNRLEREKTDKVISTSLFKQMIDATKIMPSSQVHDA